MKSEDNDAFESDAGYGMKGVTAVNGTKKTTEQNGHVKPEEKTVTSDKVVTINEHEIRQNGLPAKIDDGFVGKESALYSADLSVSGKDAESNKNDKNSESRINENGDQEPLTEILALEATAVIGQNKHSEEIEKLTEEIEKSAFDGINELDAPIKELDHQLSDSNQSSTEGEANSTGLTSTVTNPEAETSKENNLSEELNAVSEITSVLDEASGTIKEGKDITPEITNNISTSKNSEDTTTSNEQKIAENSEAEIKSMSAVTDDLGDKSVTFESSGNISDVNVGTNESSPSTEGNEISSEQTSGGNNSKTAEENKVSEEKESVIEIKSSNLN